MEKVKRRQLSLVIILILYSIYFVKIDSYSAKNKSYSTTLNESTTVFIEDFSNFTIREDHNEIISVNNNYSITFEHPYSGNAGADEYIFYLARSCTDFKINISLNYNIYTISGYCIIILSSYKNEAGDFVDDTYGVNLCYGLLDNGGLYSGAYPFDEKDEIAHGFSEVKGHSSATYIFERFDNYLICKVKCNGTLVLAEMWDAGVEKELDMIKIKAYVSSSAGIMDINFYDISGELSLIDETDFQPSTSGSYQTLVLPLIGLLPVTIILPIIVYYRTMHNKNKIG